MLTFLDLPPELLTACLSFLPVRDLVSVCQTCRTLREISKIETVWQIKCAEDFQFDSLDGWDCSFYEIYSKVLFKYGQLKGLFRATKNCYGGLINIIREPGCIKGLELYPQKDVRDPLLNRLLFSITLDDNKQLEITCHQGHGDDHPARITFDKGEKIVLKCYDKKKHRHPGGLQVEKELFNRDCQKRGMYASDLCYYKWSNCMKTEDQVEMVPLHIPTSEVPTTGIRSGLFKGMYGGHGTEIVLLHYDLESNKAKALKVTGDPNVPAGEISIEADLDRPMLLNREQQASLDMLRDIDTYDLPPDVSLDKLPKQPFEVPAGVEIEDRFPIPSSCKLRFHSLGTVSPHGYLQPTKIVNHWIVFDGNMFGVLWLDLYSFGFFSRVQEQFGVDKNISENDS